MSEYIHKSHNVSVLIYHLVCPAKYRRVVFDVEVDLVIRDVCLEISQRFEIKFLEIGVDKDHVHFLIQSSPTYSPTKIAQTVKSITAREVFIRVPSVKKKLWGGEFWTKEYFINTVGHKGNEDAVTDHVRNQGQENDYKRLHKDDSQTSLLDLF